MLAPTIPGPGINIPLSSHNPYFILYYQPLKMGLTEGSETSENHNKTPRKYPGEHIQYSEHGESLKSKIQTHLIYSSQRSSNYWKISRPKHLKPLVSTYLFIDTEI
jgi:hypothetical protein